MNRISPTLSEQNPVSGTGVDGNESRADLPTKLYLDDLDALDWAKRDPKGFVTHQAGSGVIDEIQRLPILTVAVKYAIDNENARFLMTA